MTRKMKKRKEIVDRKTSAAHDEEDKWISKMNETVVQMNEIKVELERKINNKIHYVRQIMNKKRESLDNEQAQLEDAIEQLEHVLAVIRDGSSKLETFQAVYDASETLRTCEQIQKTRPGNCHIEFLKAEHNFEAEHYVNGTLHCFTQAVETINRVYSEIQKYLPHIQEEEVEEKISIGPIQEESIPTALKLHVGEGHGDETSRKLQVPQTRNRSRSLDCGSAGFRGRDQAKERHRRLSDCYESLLSGSEKEAYPSIPTRTQCVMMVKLPTDIQDAKCCITGIVSVENNSYLVMADYRNCKIKLFSTCGSIEDELKFEEIPRDLAKIDDSTILVNFPIAKNIQIIKIGIDKNKQTKILQIEGTKILTEAKCCGIAFNDDKIYVAIQIPHQILVMNLKGEILKTISGQGLFDRATYITIDPTNSIIYISDPSKKCVLGLTEAGDITMKYDVPASHGICWAGEGKIFVADWEKGVHQIDTSGNRVADLRLDRCCCPQKLAFDVQKSILYVTEWENDTVRTICLANRC